MIFQPNGGAGSGGGLTVKTDVFATSSLNRTISLGFEAKVCIVIYEKSADNIGFLVAGDETRISTASGKTSSYVSLSSDGRTLSSSSSAWDSAILYLALG